MKVKGVLRAAMCTGVLWAAGSGLASAQDRERVIIGVNVTATPAPQSLKEAAAGTGLTLVGTNTQLAPSVDVRIAGRLVWGFVRLGSAWRWRTAS